MLLRSHQIRNLKYPHRSLHVDPISIKCFSHRKSQTGCYQLCFQRSSSDSPCANLSFPTGTEEQCLEGRSSLSVGLAFSWVELPKEQSHKYALSSPGGAFDLLPSDPCLSSAQPHSSHERQGAKWESKIQCQGSLQRRQDSHHPGRGQRSRGHRGGVTVAKPGGPAGEWDQEKRDPAHPQHWLPASECWRCGLRSQLNTQHVEAESVNYQPGII